MGKILAEIRTAIESCGQSRYAISKATGIDQGHLSKLMAGEKGLSIEKLERLCDHLQLEITITSKRRKRSK